MRKLSSRRWKISAEYKCLIFWLADRVSLAVSSTAPRYFPRDQDDAPSSTRKRVAEKHVILPGEWTHWNGSTKIKFFLFNFANLSRYSNLAYFNTRSYSKQIERRGILSFEMKLVINVERYIIVLINYRACDRISRSQETNLKALLHSRGARWNWNDVYSRYKTINDASIITGSINFFSQHFFKTRNRLIMHFYFVSGSYLPSL